MRKAVNCALLHLLHDGVEDLGLKPFLQILVDSAKLWQSFHGRIHLPVSVPLQRLIELIICLLSCTLNLAHACQGTVPDGLLVLQLARVVEEFLQSAVIFDMLLQAGVSEHLLSKELVAEEDHLGLVLEALDCVPTRLWLAEKSWLRLAFLEPKKLTCAEDSELDRAQRIVLDDLGLFAQLELRHRVDFHRVYDFLLVLNQVARLAELKAALLDEVYAVGFVARGKDCLTAVELDELQVEEQVLELGLRHVGQDAEGLKELDPSQKISLDSLLNNANVRLAVQARNLAVFSAHVSREVRLGLGQSRLTK